MSAAYSWACLWDSALPWSLPSGSGRHCYFSSTSCLSGPNACTETVPCVNDIKACSTGVAGATTVGFLSRVLLPSSWSCPLDLPQLQALPNGAGEICFMSQAVCEASANSCGSTSSTLIGSPHRCILAPGLCSTGQAVGSQDLVWFCPAQVLTNSTPTFLDTLTSTSLPSAEPNGAVIGFYFLKRTRENRPTDWLNIKIRVPALGFCEST